MERRATAYNFGDVGRTAAARAARTAVARAVSAQAESRTWTYDYPAGCPGSRSGRAAVNCACRSMYQLRAGPVGSRPASALLQYAASADGWQVRQLGRRERLGGVHGPGARGWRRSPEGQEPRHVTLRRKSGGVEPRCGGANAARGLARQVKAVRLSGWLAGSLAGSFASVKGRDQASHGRRRGGEGGCVQALLAARRGRARRARWPSVVSLLFNSIVYAETVLCRPALERRHGLRVRRVAV